MRPRNDSAQQALRAALRRRPTGIPALASDLYVNPRTVLRWLQQFDDVCSSGAAARTRYALRRPLRGRLEVLPLYRVAENGAVEEVGSLQPVYPEGTLCSLKNLAWPVGEASRDGWWDGLPYPLYDMRPQGFLGRTFAREQHAALEVSQDPRRWSDDDILHILSRTGSHASGNLILGERALRAWQEDLQNPLPSLAEQEQVAAYIAAAANVTALGVAGGSAGGEFPKFLALRSIPGALTEHVIVKFSGQVTAGATERWSDLLVCEHLAGEQAAELPGIASARTRILQADGRTFLESERFDRLGRFGRKPLVSLETVNGHLLGSSAEDWVAPVRLLQRMGLLPTEDAQAAITLSWYGRLIANADMHFGNLSFHPEDGGFRLAPTYDMLPMRYAPLPGGEVPTVTPVFQLPTPAEREAWMQAHRCALAFWERAGRDDRISADFRAICLDNATRLADLAARVVLP